MLVKVINVYSTSILSYGNNYSIHVKISEKNFKVIKLTTVEDGIVTITIPNIYNNIMRDFHN